MIQRADERPALNECLGSRIRSEAEVKQHVKRRRKRKRDKAAAEGAPGAQDADAELTAGDEIAAWQVGMQAPWWCSSAACRIWAIWVNACPG